jgi:glycerol uptake facilitator-like aquaporin
LFLLSLSAINYLAIILKFKGGKKMAKTTTVKTSSWASVKEILAEFLGTFGLAFAVLASSKAAAGASLVGSYNSLEKVLQTSQQLGQDPASGAVVTGITYIVATGAIAAFTLAMFVLTIGKVSGCNINPAVTFGLWSSGNMKTNKATFLYACSVCWCIRCFRATISIYGWSKLLRVHSKWRLESNGC